MSTATSQVAGIMRDDALAAFRAAVVAAYGHRIERIVLFGSRARGDAGPDSDYDVAVFLHDLDDRWAEVDRLVAIEEQLRTDEGPLIRSMPFPAGGWRDAASPLMHEIRRDGVEL